MINIKVAGVGHTCVSLRTIRRSWPLDSSSTLGGVGGGFLSESVSRQGEQMRSLAPPPRRLYCYRRETLTPAQPYKRSFNVGAPLERGVRQRYRRRLMNHPDRQILRFRTALSWACTCLVRSSPLRIFEARSSRALHTSQSSAFGCGARRAPWLPHVPRT